MEEQLASIDVVHDHVQFLAGLEGVVEFDYERMLDQLEDIFLLSGKKSNATALV